MQSIPSTLASGWNPCHCSRVWNLNSSKHRAREGEGNMHQCGARAESSSQMLRDTSAMHKSKGKPSLIGCSLFYQGPSPPWQSDQKANLQICGFLITILLILKHGVWQATKAREVVLRTRLSPFTRCSEGSSSLEEAQR